MKPTKGKHVMAICVGKKDTGFQAKECGAVAELVLPWLEPCCTVGNSIRRR